MLDDVIRMAHNGHRIYLISDFHGFDTTHELLLKRLARHNSVVLIHISDVLEQELPPPDRYTVTDGVERSALATSDARAREQYHAAFGAHVRTIEDACAATRSQFIGLSTHEAAVARLGERLTH